MHAEVVCLYRDGAVLSVLDTKPQYATVWMPRDEWFAAPNPVETTFENIEPGQEMDVLLLAGSGGFEDLPIVSARQFRQEHVDQSWIANDRVMCVTGLTKTMIVGLIGNVRAAMSIRDYNAFLGVGKMDEHMLDHGALARGDFVRATVEWMRDEKDCVVLKPPVARIEGGSFGALGDRVASHIGSPDEEIPHLAPETAAAVSPLLLLEDNDACRESTKALLEQEGVEVHAARTIAEAQELMAVLAASSHRDTKGFRVAIADPNLDVENQNGVGLRMIRFLYDKGIKVIVVSGEPTARNKQAQFSDIPISAFLQKPASDRELFDMIEHARDAAPLPLRVWLQDSEIDEMPQKEAPVYDVRDFGAREGGVLDALAALERYKPGTILHVFSIQRHSWRANSIAHIGEGLRWQIFQGKIDKSPIKDAALSEIPIFENVSDGTRSHQWTLEMMHYASFFGIPLDVPGYHIVVLVGFHKSQGVFDTEFQSRALLCAERAARALEREQLRRRAQDERRFSDTGMTLASLAHELNTDVHGIEHGMSAVHMALAREERELRKDERLALAVRTRDLKKGVDEALHKTKVLRGVHGSKENVSVQYCVRRAAIACNNVLSTMENVARRITIAIPQIENEWLVKSNDAALIIVFFNIYLNAAQQIGRQLGLRPSGRIWHTWEVRLDDKGDPWAVVRTHDTGPGIHPDDWGRIFYPSVTTKPKGSGLGLHICRQLLSDIRERGRRSVVTVTRSALWGGTTFTVRLPLIEQDNS